MPMYRFQCETCGLNFTARGEPSVREAKCTGCGAVAARSLPTNVAGASTGAVVGAGPQSTGLSGLDANWDRVVAADSAAKWRQVASRQRDKIDFIESNGVTGFDLSITHEGGYRVLSPAERAASERTRAHNAAMQAHIQKLKTQKPPP